MKVLTGFAVVLVMAASAFGAVATVTDIAASDVPNPGMTAFPVPAAAGWTGSANLIFDNSAALSFSAQPYPTGNAWVNFPLSNSAITIHSLTSSTSSQSNMAIGDAPGKYYTNTQGSASDAGADNRFPYNIPRPGRDCAQDFSAIYFDLAQTATEFGVFLPAASNNWGQNPPVNDYNYVPVTNMPLDVYVLRPGDTIATAQHLTVSPTGYSPFLKIVDSAGIDGVVIRHNCDLYGGPTFGFMDVYSNVPEPVTMLLMGVGLAVVARRRVA